MAVIGSGPAGFYTAYRVMTRVKGAKVDMYEQLPVPFGLVRFGVAPDHPEVKVRHQATTHLEDLAKALRRTARRSLTRSPALRISRLLETRP